VADIVGARLADREPATAAPHRAGRPGRAAAGDLSPTLLNWYRDMTPCWLAVEPQVRRRLILQTHEWIVEGVLLPMARGEQPETADLGPTGRLVWRLVRVVPPGELDVWKAWIRLTVNDLQRALAWPASRRREAWARWLFAIPYSIPVTGRRPRDVATRSAGRHGGAA